MEDSIRVVPRDAPPAQRTWSVTGAVRENEEMTPCPKNNQQLTSIRGSDTYDT